jgi:outer membrane usher protein FimD/PapC
MESFYVSVILNGEKKGELLVSRADDGDLLVRPEDWKVTGLRQPEVPVRTVDGEPRFSLRSLPGISSVFREDTMTLELTASPSLFHRQVMDLMPRRPANVYHPKDTGGFFNYAVSCTAGNSFDFRELNVSGEIGFRTGDFLFFTDSTYAHTREEDRYVRLTSNVTYDRREEMQRVILGDFQASSGVLGSNRILGGISFSKVYRINPYFYYYPLAAISAQVPLPSVAEVYLDGNRIRTDRLSPGEHDLRNIAYYGGMREVSVVIRDPFGREQKITHPYYFTDTLLRKGLHSYSYNLGFQREQFGAESNRYSSLAFSVFHDYGFSDSLTAGFRGEGDPDLLNMGPQATFLAGNAGQVFLSASVSTAKEKGEGGAAMFAHQYQNRELGTRLFFQGRTRDYATTSDVGPAARIRYEAGAGVGYGTSVAGYFSVDYLLRDTYGGTEMRLASAGYSRTFLGNLQLQLTYRNLHQERSVNEFFAGLTYYPWTDTSLSASYRRVEDTNAYTVQAQKNQPVGEGWGARVTATKADAPAGSVTSVNPFVRYNAKRGILSAEYVGEFANPGSYRESYRLSAAGGIAYVGGAFGLSRPITDSFGLVTVDNLAGVRVYQNNQEIGRTDARGRVFVPDMGSYIENQISIADRDVPMDYSLGEVIRLVSPPLRSGSVIRFEARKYRAVTGKLGVKADGTVRPVEYHEIRMVVGGKELSFPTGKGGEFYLEDLPPGKYEATFEYRGRKCHAGLVVPQTDETIVDLGGITGE